MLTLRSSAITVQFHAVGARITSCVFDGIETTFGNRIENGKLTGDLYAGVICGRHAGRISQACFPLDGSTVHVTPNMGVHQLHGGPDSFATRPWDSVLDDNRITFTLESPDGDQGFPGHLSAKAVYRLDGATLSLTLTAQTNKPTVCNLTNHAYWNMAGHGSVLAQELMIAGRHYFPLGELLLPKGEIAPVDGTAFDFRKLRVIGQDHDFCTKLDGVRGEMKQALTLRDPVSKRQLDVSTTEGCVQTYTAIHWSPEIIGQSGPLQRSGALAIEPQNVADAPNHPAFPSSFLRPGETYRNHMEWRFS